MLWIRRRSKAGTGWSSSGWTDKDGFTGRVNAGIQGRSPRSCASSPNESARLVPCASKNRSGGSGGRCGSLPEQGWIANPPEQRWCTKRNPACESPPAGCFWEIALPLASIVHNTVRKEKKNFFSMRYTAQTVPIPPFASQFVQFFPDACSVYLGFLLCAGGSVVLNLVWQGASEVTVLVFWV